MITRFLAAAGLHLLLLSFAAVNVSAQSSGGSAESTIRKLDAAWSQAAQAKDLEKTVSYYSDDASVLPYSAPIAKGKEQIHNLWQHLMAAPGFNLHFAPSKIEIAKAGDMAFEIGTFELTMNDSSGNPSNAQGKYVVVWEKRGKDWKAAADIFNTDK